MLPVARELKYVRNVGYDEYNFVRDVTSGVQSRRHFVALKCGYIWDFPVSLIASNLRNKQNKMGVPNFMEGSLTSYEIGDPRVPKILGNWGPGSLTSYENGPGVPILGVPIFT